MLQKLEIGECTGNNVILTFDDFVEWYNNYPEQRTVTWAKIDGFRERLESSKEEIKDPIDFLYHLYFHRKFSLRKILEQPVVDNFYSVKGLRNLFVDSFLWELREKTQKTPEHQRILDERTKQQILEFSERVKGLLHGRPRERVFKMSEFREKKYRIGKALYLLKTLGGIDKNILFQLSQEGCLEKCVIARGINEQLKQILLRFPELNIPFEEVELNSQSIVRWIRYYKREQKKAD